MFFLLNDTADVANNLVDKATPWSFAIWGLFALAGYVAYYFERQQRIKDQDDRSKERQEHKKEDRETLALLIKMEVYLLENKGNRELLKGIESKIESMQSSINALSINQRKE